MRDYIADVALLTIVVMLAPMLISALRPRLASSRRWSISRDGTMLACGAAPDAVEADQQTACARALLDRLDDLEDRVTAIEERECGRPESGEAAS